MNNKQNFGNPAGTLAFVPKFSLIREDPKLLDNTTVEAFTYADAKERHQLFKMRAFLNSLFPNGIKDSISTEEYIESLEHIHNALPKDVYIPFPGVLPYDISSSFDSHRLLKISNQITLSLEDKDLYIISLNTLDIILNSGLHRNIKIYLIADRIIPMEAISLICRLWNKGADLTICYGKRARDMLKYSGMITDECIDICNGIPLIPGRSVSKYISLCKESLPESNDTRTLYAYIQKAIGDILKNEVNTRFIRNGKGELHYRVNNDPDELIPFSLFYPGCISNTDKIVKGILSGGVEYDYISVTVDKLNPDDTEYTATVLRCLSSACKFYDGIYPLKVVPFFSDDRYACSIEDPYKIIPLHANLIKPIYSGSKLKLHVSDGFDLSDKESVYSIISAFFAYGGMMLSINNSGELNE